MTLLSVNTREIKNTSNMITSEQSLLEIQDLTTNNVKVTMATETNNSTGMGDNKTSSLHTKGVQQMILESLNRIRIVDVISPGIIMRERGGINGPDLETEKKVSQKHPHLETDILIWTRMGQEIQG